ncbi:alpha-1,3/1,6-mannosyltransferase ALG2 [Dichotomocladium elegans]|nr:alpha-1,3/1,6-mannosyltransferase ALG2 [Dichotomocladium elegans]
MTERPLKIAFVHPDLGIGGAERLVVDAAVGMQSKGHQVVCYTSHHDPKHCFQETRDGTLEVIVQGDFLPRTLFGRFYILCAILRQLFLSLTILYKHRNTYDVLFIDQLSACIPLFKLFSSSRILFYCHHPDKLLTTRESALKKIYRTPVDLFEEWTTAMADGIAVNSEYTASVTRASFPSIRQPLKILYPPINFACYDRTLEADDQFVRILKTSKNTLLSINRFERKKNVALALRAFAYLKEQLSEDAFYHFRLVLAGGYDRRVIENVEYLDELEHLARNDFGLKTFILFPDSSSPPPDDTQVLFVCSFNDSQRTFLLRHSTLMLYTPSNEHFGITPVEGMYSSLPVIATNSGGPMETVIHGETGLLLPPDPATWGNGIKDIVTGHYDARQMGRKGREHVRASFSLSAFADKLQGVLEEMMANTASRWTPWMAVAVVIAAVLMGTVFRVIHTCLTI